MIRGDAIDVSSIAAKLANCDTQSEVYRIIVQEVSELLSLSRCIFVPSDSSHGDALIPIEWSNGLESSKERDRLLVELVYYLQDVSRSIVGLVAINDARDSTLLSPIRGSVSELEIASIAILPISNLDLPGASLLLIQEEESREWTQREKNFLQSLRPHILDALSRCAKTAEGGGEQVPEKESVNLLREISVVVQKEEDLSILVQSILENLSAVINADASFCYLLPSSKSLRPELVAVSGFSKSFVRNLQSQPAIANEVLLVGEEVIHHDLRNVEASIFVEEQGLVSGMLLPIISKSKIVGVLGCFSKRKAVFSTEKLELARVVSLQIGLAHYKKDLYERHKTQEQSLTTLYRMSHELSRPLTLDDLFQQAFKVIRDELGLKRLWVGLLNDPGTRIIGQAAYGPGLRKSLVEVSVELEGRNNPIARVIESKSPLVIDDPEQVLKAFGVKRIFSRLEISSIVLVPLIAGGQLHGVLAVQPQKDSSLLDSNQVSLLMSLASEVATMVLSKRLEERLASGEKMRTAALLAAGIAHNFNNILQAVMGQASLLDMQSEKDSSISHATKVIKDAAQKGAVLVKQLLSVANLEDPHREVCNINSVIEQGLDELSGLLNDGQEIYLDLDDKLPKVYVDPRHLMRILRTLITNAAEAMDSTGLVEIFTDVVEIGPESPHYEVPYGDFVRIGVRDSGVGMDSEMKRRCFEPFFTTKDVDPGSGLGMSGAGLGLAAAYALSRRNGGRLVVDSRPGHGTLFTLYVRVADEKAIGDEDLSQEKIFFDDPKLTSIQSYQEQKEANKKDSK